MRSLKRFERRFNFIFLSLSLQQDYIDAASHNVYQIGDCGDKEPPPPPPVCTPDPTPLGCYDVSLAGCANNAEHKTNAVRSQQFPFVWVDNDCENERFFTVMLCGA